VIDIRYRLGQTPDEWLRRAREAVANFDDLLAELAHVADDTVRGQILLWIGREDVPGSPAERYKVVVGDLERAAAYTEEIPIKRVEELERAVDDLYQRVAGAGRAYGLFPGAEGAEKPRMAPIPMMTAFVLGSIVFVGLAVPFMLE
jgi:tetrahydromethanopterin S-methyltransferase subunit B